MSRFLGKVPMAIIAVMIAVAAAQVADAQPGGGQGRGGGFGGQGRGGRGGGRGGASFASIAANPEVQSLVKATDEQKAKITAIGPDIARPRAAASFALGAADGYIPLAGLIDLSAEKARQEKEAEKLRGFIAGSEKRLSIASFTDRAPPEVVQEVRDTLASQKKQLASVEEILRELDAV